MRANQWLAVGTLAVLCAANTSAGEHLYRCERDGKSVFTNRADLSPGCRAFALSSSNVASNVLSVRAESSSQDMVCASTNEIAAELLAIKRRCQDIRFEMGDLAAQLRGKYTPQQGRQINARLDELEAQLNAERCHSIQD